MVQLRSPHAATKKDPGDFPGGPVAKSPPYNAGDTGLIPGQGTTIPHAMWQVCPHAATGAHVLQTKIGRASCRERV